MASKKAAAKKKPATKAAPKKAAAKKAAPKKAAAKKAAPKKAAAKKATKAAPKKAAAKKAPAKKAAVKKAPAKKAAPKKAAKKAPVKKAAAKKAPVKKAAVKATAEKAPAKKSRSRASKKAGDIPVSKMPARVPKKKPAQTDNKPLEIPAWLKDKKWLASQREQLLEERRTYTHNADALAAEAAALMADREPGDVQFDEESGEGDTLAVERDRDLALSAKAREKVDEIDAALARLDAGTYGICVSGEDIIPKERLEALAMASKCVRHQTQMF